MLQVGDHDQDSLYDLTINNMEQPGNIINGNKDKVIIELALFLSSTSTSGEEAQQDRHTLCCVYRDSFGP